MPTSGVCWEPAIEGAGAERDMELELIPMMKDLDPRVAVP